MKSNFLNSNCASLRLATSIASLIAVLVVAVHPVVGHAQQSSPSLAITSPASGTLVPSGQSLSISVSSSGGPFTAVQVIGENSGSSSVLANSPYNFSLAIPSQTVGLKKITAVGITAAGIPVF